MNHIKNKPQSMHRKYRSVGNLLIVNILDAKKRMFYSIDQSINSFDILVVDINFTNL